MPNVLPERIISADCHINEPPHVFDTRPVEVEGACAEDAARRRRRRRLELRRRAAQADLRDRGDRRACGRRQEDVGAALRRDPPGQPPGQGPRRGHGQGRDRRLRRVSRLRGPGLRHAGPRARRRLHALLQRLDPRRVPGGISEAHRRLPLLPVDDGMDVCIAELERCVRQRCEGGPDPGPSRAARITIATTTRSSPARRRPVFR